MKRLIAYWPKIRNRLKKSKGLFAILTGGLSLSVFGGFQMGLFNFSPSVTLTSQLSLISEELSPTDLAEEKAWHESQNILADFYRRINFGRYESARNLLTENYARNLPLYSVEQLKHWKESKRGVTNIIELNRDPGESSPTTKVFTYRTQYTLKEDRKQHGELLKAYIVNRNGNWTIDTIQDLGVYR